MRLNRDAVFTDLGKRFIDNTLRRVYEDDDGGHQPEERAALVAQMQAVWDGSVSESLALSFIDQLLAAMDRQLSILTYEDVVVVANLCRLFVSEAGSPLRIGATIGKWLLVHGILQSGDQVVRYRLRDREPVLIPIADVTLKGRTH